MSSPIPFIDLRAQRTQLSSNNRIKRRAESQPRAQLPHLGKPYQLRLAHTREPELLVALIPRDRRSPRRSGRLLKPTFRDDAILM